MGNRPSTHSPELVDTSLDDWYGSKYAGNDRGNAHDYGPRQSQQHEQQQRGDDDQNARYDTDVRENPVLGLDDRRPYDKGMEPLVQTTAAVFHMNMMEQRQDDDEVSVSQRSAAVFEHLEQEAEQGNHQPIINLLETASAVGKILSGSFDGAASASGSEGGRSTGDLFKVLGDQNNVIDVEKIQANAVFELLDKVKSIDENHVAQFSSAVFEMLETARSFSNQPPEERKINIFRMLEENNLRATGGYRDGRDDEQYYGASQFGREDYPEVVQQYSPPEDEEEVSLLENLPEDESVRRTIPIQTMEGDPIDLVFVQDFDNAFNEFIGQNPRFLLKSPDLVHSIRVSKLQKLLAYMFAKERSLLTDIAKLKANKQGMEDSYQTLLREASRGKAARQIYFQAELEKVAMISKTLEAKFKWAVVASAEARTKRHQHMHQSYAQESPDETRDQVLSRLPRDIPGEHVYNMLQGSGIDHGRAKTVSEKLQEIRQLQVNIAFLSSEIKIWQKKLEIMQVEKQKVAWIEHILQQMTEKQMSRLKSRFQKKVGVQFD